MSTGQPNVRTREYKKLLAGLPLHIQQLAEGAFQLFEAHPQHPSLRHHALTSTGRGRHRAQSFSVSISNRYRAIYVVDGGTNVWYWVGSHEDYNTFTGKK